MIARSTVRSIGLPIVIGNVGSVCPKSTPNASGIFGCPSLMIFVIAQLRGISDYAALLAIFGLNFSMILFGWLQEKYSQTDNGNWLPFIFGCIAGIIPWLIVAIQLFSPKGPSGASAPGFVYGNNGDKIDKEKLVEMFKQLSFSQGENVEPSYDSTSFIEIK